MSKLLWTPSQELIDNANITKFIKFVNSKLELAVSDYNELYDWSIENISTFWELLAHFTDIKFSKQPTEIVSDLDQFPPATKWFVGAELNFAENLLRFNDDRVALISKDELNNTISITYSELRNKVGRLSNALIDLGIKSGDRIVAYMPNIIETVIAMLAATSIGAVWSSCGAELGASAALDRLGQIKPKVLFSVDGYWYKGSRFDQFDKIKTVCKGISSLEKVVIFPFTSKIIDEEKMNSIQNSILFDEFLSPSEELTFNQVSFSHPLYIMFSSGTTGKPKCMVQSTGGVLLNHLKEHVLHTNMKREDILFYLTSPSWMMWNWLISGLTTGATLVLYDGNPLYPDWKRAFEFIDELKISVFGCSASYIHYLKNLNADPSTTFDLKSLKGISQTGSTLSDEGFHYVYEKIKVDLHLNSISGGTDINGCFAAGVPTLPVFSGELQARSLGMKVMAYDENGESIIDEEGELVCEKPSPSMPIYFWNDNNGDKYSNAYFNYYNKKKVWRHGDYIIINSKRGGVTFLGRSDSTLKPSGVRIGTSEIYSIVENFPEITDSLVIGLNWKSEQEIILFVQLSEESTLNEELKQKIINDLKIKASPRHVPHIIVQVYDIPYTFSGKKVESAITNIFHEREITNKDALRNPESLKYYEDIKNSIKNKSN
ncbi:MAG: acetoacetate--CoA ligase [Candidatus Heimdallarchaeota archaeon]|nr:acetoacetate--CoA ligase [Candidatus Heimdallarchaeota archaeon]